MRLFIALPIADRLKSQIADLPHRQLKAQWQDVDDMHITLRFVDDVCEGALEQIKDVLAQIRRPRFHIEVRGLGVFADGQNRVLYGDVQSHKKITALTAIINEKFSNIGFEMPLRPYVPHVTIARQQGDQNLDRFIRSHANKIQTSWMASAFYLCESGTAVTGGNLENKSLQRFDLQ